MEHRVDPADATAYTWPEIVDRYYYKGEYGKKADRVLLETALLAAGRLLAGDELWKDHLDSESRRAGGLAVAMAGT